MKTMKSKRTQWVRQAVEDARSKAVYHRNETNGDEYRLLDEVSKALMELTLLLDKEDN